MIFTIAAFFLSFVWTIILSENIVLFFATGAILNRTVTWLILFVLAIILTRIIDIFTADKVTERSIYEVADWLIDATPEFDRYQIKEIKLSEFKDDGMLKAYDYAILRYLRQKTKGIPTTANPLRVFNVCCKRPPYPAQLKSFVGLQGPSLIFLRDTPASIKGLAKFSTLHELGHISEVGLQKRAYRLRALFHVVLGSIIITYSCDSNWLRLGILFFFAVRYVRSQLVSKLEEEFLADGFAVRHLSTQESKEVAQSLESVWLDPDLPTKSVRIRNAFRKRIERIKKAIRSPRAALHFPTEEFDISHILSSGFVIYAASKASSLMTINCSLLIIVSILIWIKATSQIRNNHRLYIALEALVSHCLSETEVHMEWNGMNYVESHTIYGTTDLSESMSTLILPLAIRRFRRPSGAFCDNPTEATQAHKKFCDLLLNCFVGRNFHIPKRESLTSRGNGKVVVRMETPHITVGNIDDICKRFSRELQKVIGESP